MDALQEAHEALKDYAVTRFDVAVDKANRQQATCSFPSGTYRVDYTGSEGRTVQDCAARFPSPVKWKGAPKIERARGQDERAQIRSTFGVPPRLLGLDAEIPTLPPPTPRNRVGETVNCRSLTAQVQHSFNIRGPANDSALDRFQDDMAADAERVLKPKRYVHDRDMGTIRAEYEIPKQPGEYVGVGFYDDDLVQSQDKLAAFAANQPGVSHRDLRDLAADVGSADLAGGFLIPQDVMREIEGALEGKAELTYIGNKLDALRDLAEELVA